MTSTWQPTPQSSLPTPPMTPLPMHIRDTWELSMPPTPTPMDEMMLEHFDHNSSQYPLILRRTRLIRTTSLMELGSPRVRPRSLSTTELPFLPNSQPDQFTRYLLPITEETLDSLFILECTLGTAASVLGNPRTPAPLAKEIYTALRLAEKKINHQKKRVNHWWSCLFKEPADTLRALRAWILTPRLNDEPPSPPLSLALI